MKLQLLTPLTVLPPPDDRRGDIEIIEEWARGLDWVHWLLGSVRARTENLMVNGSGWQGFTDGPFRDHIGPALEISWLAAHRGDLQSLIAADTTLTESLDHGDNRRGIHAGGILLKSTRHARYQGVLGHFRDQIASGACEGHLATVWATVGNFFQLSLANVIAEYLRLEWEIDSRHTRDRTEPNFALLTRELLLDKHPSPRSI